MRPTPAGEVFRRHAPATLDEADRSVRRAGGRRRGRRPAVGATPFLAAGIAPEAIRPLPLLDLLAGNFAPDAAPSRANLG